MAALTKSQVEDLVAAAVASALEAANAPKERVESVPESVIGRSGSKTQVVPAAAGKPLCEWTDGDTVCGKPVAFRRDGEPKRWCPEHVKSSREAWKARVQDGAALTASRREENAALMESLLAVVDGAPVGSRPKGTKVRLNPASSSFCYYLVKEGFAEREGWACTVEFPSRPKADAFVKALGAATLELSSKPVGEVL